MNGIFLDDKLRRIISIVLAVAQLLGAMFILTQSFTSTTTQIAAVGLMAIALLDVVWYFMFESKTKSAFLTFIKNAVYYILVVAELLAVAFCALCMAEDNATVVYAAEGIWVLALCPAVVFGTIIKPLLHRLVYRMETGNNLTPFVALASHLAGYLVGLLVLFFGEMAPFIFNWGSLILFGVGLVVAFKFIFIGLPFHKDDAYVYGDGGYSYSSSSSSSSSYSGSSNNSKTEYTGSGSFTYKGYNGSYKFDNYYHWSKSKLVIKYPLNEIQKEHGYGYVGEADVKEFVLEKLGVPWDEIDIEMNIYGF